MDWSKAKNILIAALLVTNLVLLGAIYGNTDRSGVNDGENIKEDTVLLLKEHEIYVEESLIPDRSQRMPVLSVRYRTAEEEAVNNALKESTTILSESASEEEYSQAADELLAAAGISCNDFIHREIQRQENRVDVVYGVEYEGYSLDNARLTVSFQEGKPVAMETSWVEAVAMGKNKKRIMTASTALVKFMTALESDGENHPREAVIVDEIRLVYWLEGYTESGSVSEDTAVPYWCIRYNGDQRSYIAAYEQ